MYFLLDFTVENEDKDSEKFKLIIGINEDSLIAQPIFRSLNDQLVVFE